MGDDEYLRCVQAVPHGRRPFSPLEAVGMVSRFMGIGVLIVALTPVMWLLAAAGFIGIGAEWLAQRIDGFVTGAIGWARNDARVRETWTQHDPELAEREFLAKERRKELSKR